MDNLIYVRGRYPVADLLQYLTKPLLESIMDGLTPLSRAYNDLQQARKDFTPIKERWYTWNYWAQHQQTQFVYGIWMREHDLYYEDVAGSKTNYPKRNILLSRDEGYRYYSAWRGGQKAVDDLEQLFDRLFRDAWETTRDGKYAYTNTMLGAAVSMTADQLRKFASKRSWYYPRGHQ